MQGRVQGEIERSFCKGRVRFFFYSFEICLSCIFRINFDFLKYRVKIVLILIFECFVFKVRILLDSFVFRFWKREYILISRVFEFTDIQGVEIRSFVEVRRFGSFRGQQVRGKFFRFREGGVFEERVGIQYFWRLGYDVISFTGVAGYR